jgi:hypothetical protein
MMEWHYLAVTPEIKQMLDNLVSKEGKYAGYKKYRLVEMALKTIKHL